MPKVILDLECELCGFKTNEWGTKWRDHLLRERHQKITRERNRMLEDVDKTRCCVVLGVRGLTRRRRRDVLGFFSEKGVVTEFVFWPECPDVLLVQFLLPNAAEDVSKGTKFVLGKEVVVRLRHEISDDEWRCTCPAVAVYLETEEETGVVEEIGYPSVKGLKWSDDECALTNSAVKKEPNEKLPAKCQWEDLISTSSVVLESSYSKSWETVFDVKADVSYVDDNSSCNQPASAVSAVSASSLKSIRGESLLTETGNADEDAAEVLETSHSKIQTPCDVTPNGTDSVYSSCNQTPSSNNSRNDLSRERHPRKRRACPLSFKTECGKSRRTELISVPSNRLTDSPTSSAPLLKKPSRPTEEEENTSGDVSTVVVVNSYISQTKHDTRESLRTEAAKEAESPDASYSIVHEATCDLKSIFNVASVHVGSSCNHTSSSNDNESNVTDGSAVRKRLTSLSSENSEPRLEDQIQNLKQAVEAVKLTCVNNCYCLSMAPSKQFLADATDAAKTKIVDTTQVDKFKSFWVQLIAEFNRLVWENLFGFELYEITADVSQKSGRFQCKKGYAKDGPLLRGTLTVITDKLADWILNTEERDKQTKRLEFERLCLKSLEEGLEPKPLRLFDNNARSLYISKSHFVSFDLQVSLATGPGDNPSSPLLSDLHFYNVTCSHDFTVDTFKMIILMYERIWRHFCFLKCGGTNTNVVQNSAAKVENKRIDILPKQLQTSGVNYESDKCLKSESKCGESLRTEIANAAEDAAVLETSHSKIHQTPYDVTPNKTGVNCSRNQMPSSNNYRNQLSLGGPPRKRRACPLSFEIECGKSRRIELNDLPFNRLTDSPTNCAPLLKKPSWLEKEGDTAVQVSSGFKMHETSCDVNPDDSSAAVNSLSSQISCAMDLETASLKSDCLETLCTEAAIAIASKDAETLKTSYATVHETSCDWNSDVASVHVDSLCNQTSSSNDSKSNETDESVEKTRWASLLSGNSEPKLEDQIQNVKQTLEVMKPKYVNDCYCLWMAPSKQFLLETEAAKTKIVDTTQVDKFKSFWVHQIVEFNRLVWENLFGFELYEITPEISQKPDRLLPFQCKKGYAKDGPFLRGTLNVITDKLADLILNTEVRDKQRKVKEVEFKRLCLNSLKEGLDPKPFRFFDSEARSSYFRKSNLVSFDLQVSHATGPGKSGNNPSSPILCDLHFYNITHSHDFAFNKFRMIMLMYRRIWEEFCLMRKFRDMYVVQNSVEKVEDKRIETLPTEVLSEVSPGRSSSVLEAPQSEASGHGGNE